MIAHIAICWQARIYVAMLVHTYVRVYTYACHIYIYYVYYSVYLLTYACYPVLPLPIYIHMYVCT